MEIVNMKEMTTIHISLTAVLLHLDSALEIAKASLSYILLFWTTKTTL